MANGTFLFLTLVFLNGTAPADRPLAREEVLGILDTLTSRPVETWIDSGTIVARHEEYTAPKTADPNEISEQIKREVEAYVQNPQKLEIPEKLQIMKLEAIPFNVRYRLTNEYTMISTATVRYDGARFYWEIGVDARTDSVTPTADLAGNSFTEIFDLGWNERRVYAWDDEKYTVYFRPGNYAIVTKTPSSVNGPLTAGVVPWGYGRYGYESLLNAELSAVEAESLIHLKVTKDGMAETLVLDPQKGYAIRFYTSITANSSMEARKYDGYQLVGGKWCPTSIMIERFDLTKNPARLTARDIWDFASISNEVLPADSFDVKYDYDALIEDYRFDGKPLQYRYSKPEQPSVRNIDPDKISRSRLAIASCPEPQRQNCATVSLKYVCGKFGVEASWEDLSNLVHGQARSSTLLEMQEFLHGLGLIAVPVKTDLGTLKRLVDCQTILHLPGYNHYVVLGEVDSRYVRLLDLGQNGFYYRVDIGSFERVWDGVALVVADRPISVQGNLVPVEGRQLHSIVGAAVCQQCNNKLQNSADFPCTTVGGVCGNHTKVLERWGCGSAASGTCSESTMASRVSVNCEPNIRNPNECIDSGEWKETASISACW